jgi:hypothetical protein
MIYRPVLHGAIGINIKFRFIQLANVIKFTAAGKADWLLRFQPGQHRASSSK